MNETLYDLEQKRKAVEQDIQALYETLQKEINEQKKIWEKTNSLISYILIIVSVKVICWSTNLGCIQTF